LRDSRSESIAAIVLGVGAGLAAGLAVLLYMMAPSESAPASVPVTLAPMGSGGGLVFSGRLP
jgi:hypothetical protein